MYKPAAILLSSYRGSSTDWPFSVAKFEVKSVPTSAIDISLTAGLKNMLKFAVTVFDGPWLDNRKMFLIFTVTAVYSFVFKRSMRTVEKRNLESQGPNLFCKLK
jgi:uncharacterized membrane protein SirB2